jgi:hypothetical protein
MAKCKVSYCYNTWGMQLLLGFKWFDLQCIKEIDDKILGSVIWNNCVTLLIVSF